MPDRITKLRECLLAENSGGNRENKTRAEKRGNRENAEREKTFCKAVVYRKRQRQEAGENKGAKRRPQTR